MSSNVFRKVVIALLVSTTLTLAAAPAQASRLLPHHKFEDPSRNGSPRGLIALLLHYFFEDAGGAMDPNGSH